jgi:aminopeptidase N
MNRSKRSSGACAALLAAAALVAAAPAVAAPPEFSPGSDGLGDPYFPLAGNGGYDVQHYSLDLDYVRAGNQLDAVARIRAKATQDLSRFNLDLRGFEIGELEVNGQDAAYSRDGQELTVVPQHGLRRNSAFVVRIEYAGTPEEVIDPDGSSEGWVPTADGAFVVNEPQGSPGWFPANDNPQDKATYDFSVTVPEGITAIGNGVLESSSTSNGKTTWNWSEDSPMASYLTTVTNGEFDLRTSSWRGMPLYHAVDPTISTAALAFERLANEPRVLDLFSELFGPYPFSSGGGVVDRGGVGYALESQTRSMYDGTPGAGTVVHEIAHQWFGNAVTLAVWPDIWLNEGFARWSEWIYTERTGGRSASAAFFAAYNARPASSSFWARPTANLGGPAFMFGSQPYDRGGMTLQALREKVGDDAFFRIIRTWYEENKYGDVTTADFIALSERISGQQLDEFFDVWLYRPVKPTVW